MKKNAIVAQSGGPSPVINSSLQGVVDGCLAYSDHIDTIYAGWHGIEGVLLEELIDISRQPRQEIELLRYTPAAGAIGTCQAGRIDADSSGCGPRAWLERQLVIGRFETWQPGEGSRSFSHRLSCSPTQRCLCPCHLVQF